jgi:hypothetical protein
VGTGKGTTKETGGIVAEMLDQPHGPEPMGNKRQQHKRKSPSKKATIEVQMHFLYFPRLFIWFDYNLTHVNPLSQIEGFKGTSINHVQVE